MIAELEHYGQTLRFAVVSFEWFITADLPGFLVTAARRLESVVRSPV